MRSRQPDGRWFGSVPTETLQTRGLVGSSRPAAFRGKALKATVTPLLLVIVTRSTGLEAPSELFAETTVGVETTKIAGGLSADTSPIQ